MNHIETGLYSSIYVLVHLPDMHKNILKLFIFALRAYIRQNQSQRRNTSSEWHVSSCDKIIFFIFVIYESLRQFK
jgi:hypothetical protein